MVTGQSKHSTTGRTFTRKFGSVARCVVGMYVNMVRFESASRFARGRNAGERESESAREAERERPRGRGREGEAERERERGSYYNVGF